MKTKILLAILITAFAIPSLALAASLTPITVVNQRMAAYNNHDIKKFMALYSDNISIYTYPDLKLSNGKEHLESIFKPMFTEGNLSVKIIKQVENGNYVINEEIVNDSNTHKKYVSIYKVENGLITEVRFVRE